ncbi:ATP-binding cassette domain-containing protein [Streptomyces sp. HD]|uniref:ATP-binding cassette domain-containing protein n=1 Tax=Streptomyces sp. HD TaxID=3020892 RepID=UPI00232FB496|nr:ATP-binding cassette domain-containing protein [Streptomyces sp. HD]MDC0766347.1 ATP-binding cassette domain-containing protein [Streptomyces sp. HD]
MAWSLVQAVPAFLSGWIVARAVDDGFLTGRPATGFLWLGVLALACLVGAWATRHATLGLAALIEPFRDELVTLVTTGTLRRSARLGEPADTAGVARLTEHVERARDAYGAIVLFVQGFLVTTVGVCVGLAGLDPVLLVLVLPPLLIGLALFAAALRAMAARQREVILADERIAEAAGALTGGLRDVVACGAEERVRAQTGARVDAAARAAVSLARLTAVRTAALGISGWVPLLLILLGAPWLVRNGATAGAILGAVTYVSQALQPALQGFVQGLGSSGLWLLVTVGRMAEIAAEPPRPEPTETGATEPRAAGPEAGAAGAGAATAGATDPRAAQTGIAEPRAAEAGAAKARATEARATEARATEAGSTEARATEAGAAKARATEARATEARATKARATEAGSTEACAAKARATEAGATEARATEAGAAKARATEAGAAKAGSGAVPTHAPVPPGGGRVEVRGLTFGYAESAEPVVQGLDLVVRPGEHLAVVGPSGAGKSTLAALIAGVLEPRAGRVRLDGVPVLELAGDDLARHRVLIPQEAYVFSGTLEENLTYLVPGAARADVEATVRAVGAAELVQRLGGYDAPLDPGDLSAGERQLVALARALLPAPRLTLLDEATCHLDPVAEAVAERAFARRPGTLIVVAHRISSALRADRILVMDGTRIVLGTHEELIAGCALYRDLVGHWGAPDPPLAPVGPRSRTRRVREAVRVLLRLAVHLHTVTPSPTPGRSGWRRSDCVRRSSW